MIHMDETKAVAFGAATARNVPSPELGAVAGCGWSTCGEVMKGFSKRLV
jgi:hypothetical protein